MPTHIADIPNPCYAFVRDEFLHDCADGFGDVTECLLYGLSALPGRAWGISAMLKNGALVQHLPVHAFSKLPDKRCRHKLSEQQVWACYGLDFATHQYNALSEMPLRVYMKDTQTYVNGRYWFTAAPYNDLYSMTPDQHKHFNFIWLECGCLVAMPGNRVEMYDSSFIEWGKERPKYAVNTQYWYPEEVGNKPFDGTITPFSG